MVNKLTERALRLTARGVTEGGKALKSHLEFAREGGELFWIVDTDVVTFFFNPRENARYADIFPTPFDAIKAAKQPPGLVALAATLADFVFSDRFHFSHGGHGDSGQIINHRLLLEPHTNELHEVLQAVIRRTTLAATRATDAVLERRLAKEVNELITAYRNDVAQKPQQFISKAQAIIASHLDFILPDSPLEELIRARVLLKSRKAAIYEADCPWLHDLLNQEAAVRAVDDLTDGWRNSILAEVERLNEFRARSFRSTHPQVGVIRTGDLALREQRDARVLAKLEYLNDLFSKEGNPKRRFVMISGHGLLRGVVRDRNWRRRRKGLPECVFTLHPNVFLGSPHLFPLPNASEHWVRMTSALVLLDGTRRPGDKNGEQSELPIYSDGDNSELVRKIETEWQELQDFALPFLPTQSRDKRIQEIFKGLLTGEPLEALERALYLALSELFVVMAELGLSPHHEHGIRLPRREPPPLRLAYYPAAEACIQALIGNMKNPIQGNEQQNIGTLIENVKQEQINSKVEDFNYPLLLCLATRFAALGDWHAARVLANHAASVAKVTEREAPLVTGREAAYLECYCRCLEAKNIKELELAKKALKEYQAAILREAEWWKVPANQASEAEYCKALKFNPLEEFRLHEIRAQSEELLLELTHWMYEWFVDDRRESETVNFVEESFESINSMLVDLETLTSNLEQLGMDKVPATDTVSMIVRSVKMQIQMCAMQCMVLLFAGDPQRRESLRASWLRSHAAMNNLGINATSVTRMIVLVALCIWGTTEEQTTALQELDGEDISFDFTPYDSGRRVFFKAVALSGTKADQLKTTASLLPH